MSKSKFLSPEQRAMNLASSNFSELLSEFDDDSLTKESLIQSISKIVIALNDTDASIELLKKQNQCNEIEDEIMRIKVVYGY